MVHSPSSARTLQASLYNACSMTAPTTLFRPYDKLVKITLLGREVEVPENNTLLRCLQFLAPEVTTEITYCLRGIRT